jgi:glutaredoxin 3
MAKEFLSENKIHYIAKDINVDQQARAEMMRRKVTGVPAFLIGEDMVVGLDKAKILQLVDHRLIECEKCHTKMRVPHNQAKIKITCPKCGHTSVR